MEQKVLLNRIYNEDARLTMRRIGDNFVDLTITSPPYDKIRQYGNNPQHEWNETVWKTIIRDLYRITKVGGIVVWIVADQTTKGDESGTSFEQALWAKKCGFRLHDTMIYLKDNPAPVGGKWRYYQAFEYMFVFTKGKPKTFNPITRKRRNKHRDKRTERYKSFVRKPDGTFVKKLTKINEIVKVNNVWKYVVGGGNSVKIGINHPAAFPPKLVRDHMLTWSNPGDVVYDPFAGSGTVFTVCQNENRFFLGSERVGEYLEVWDRKGLVIN